MTDEMKESDGWREWSRYVLKTLEHQSDKLDKLNEKLDNTTKELREKIDLINATLGGRLTLLQAKVFGIAAVSSLLTTIVFWLMSRILGTH